MSSANTPHPHNVESTLCRILVPATALFMIIVTGVAVILRKHTLVVFWTGLAEGVCLLTGIYLFRLLSRRITRPVAVLADAADRLTASGKSAQLPTDSPLAEINQLATSFNRLFAAQDARLAELRDLTTNILHDIRTPLTQITGDAEAVALGDYPATEAAARALAACRTILRLIDTNAEIARANAGDSVRAPQEIDLNALVRDASELFAPAAEAKSVKLLCQTPGTPLFFPGHVDRLQRLVGNLIDNAVKFTPAGGTITVTLSRTSSSVVLRVTDTGIGMTSKIRERIFERFYRADTSRHETGFGLGLSLVKALVGFYRGTIAVESEIGRGTTFTVTLPASPTGN